MALMHNARSIVTDGLILCLDAANPKSYPGSGTTWTDLSGEGNNLTLTNGPTYDTGNGGSLTFDGVNDHASRNLSNSIISNPSLNNMNISVNFWCNVTSASSYYILSSGAQTSSTGVAFSYQNGNPFYTIRGTNTESFLYFDVSNFPLNTWINWCFTSNGTSFILYKNGSQIRSNGFSAGSFSTVHNIISIGKPNNADSFYAAMKFSNLSIYKKTLSAAEVSQNFNALRGRYAL